MSKISSLVIVLCAFSSTAFCQTTLGQEKKNNTSAADVFGPTATGFIDYRDTINSRMDFPIDMMNHFPIISQTIDTLPGNISLGRHTRGDMHSLMYPGFNGKILAETQTWFCNDVNHGIVSQESRFYVNSNHSINGHSWNICNSHQIVGYNSVVHGAAIVDDMFARGLDGFIADSMGDPNGCGYPSFNMPCGSTPSISNYNVVSTGISTMVGQIKSKYSGIMQYALMEDQAAFKFQENCQNTGTAEPDCIERRIEHDIDFYNAKYFQDSNYIRVGNIPVLLFFIDENSFLQHCSNTSCTTRSGSTCASSATCWTAIWNGIHNHGVALLMIFQNEPGFRSMHTQSNGAYVWVHPSPAAPIPPTNEVNGNITRNSQENWDDDFSGAFRPSPTDSNYLGELYHFANCIHTGVSCAVGDIFFAVAYKGFDREDAAFGLINQGQVIAQRCGQTWLSTFQKAGGSDNAFMPPHPYFSTTQQLPFMVVATWDDYDEGSEIESGIDNCVDETPGTSFTISQPDRTSTISWQFKFSDPVYGALSTINRYRLFFTTRTDGTALSGLDVFPSCTNANGSVNCPGVNLKKLRVWQPGTYQIYIKAIGQPSIFNHMFCAQNQQGCFATFTPSAVSTSSTTLDFGSVPAGSSSAQNVTVSYSGNADVSGTISLTSTGVFQLQTPSSCLLTQQNPTCQVTVIYTPTSSSGDSGSLIISHDGASGVNTVALTGNGGSAGGCGSGPSLIANIDDMTSWTRTEGSATATLTQNVSTPSIDGASAQFSLTGGPSYTYAKWENYLGPNGSASEFQLDLQAQVDQPNNPEMIEFGVSQIIGGNTYADNESDPYSVWIDSMKVTEICH